MLAKVFNCTYLLYACMYISRALELYVIIGSVAIGICFWPFNSINSTSTEVPDGSNTSEALPLTIAYWITRVSLFYELTVGYGTNLIVACCLFRFYKCQWQRLCCFNLDETRMNEIIRAVRPLVIFDCISVVLLGPIGNVQMFVLKCPEGYVSVVLRIGFYLSALSLPTVYVYLRNRDEEPQLGELTDLVSILIKIALRLVTCSSCLATFITIAYPEQEAFRYTYLAFTIIIGITALLTYYEAVAKLVEVARDKTDSCVKFHDYFNHFIFWPSTIANLGLLGMNAYILNKYLSSAGFSSSGVSLVLNCLGFIVGTAIYTFGSKFCGHGPLCKMCKNCCSRDE